MQVLPTRLRVKQREMTRTRIRDAAANLWQQHDSASIAMEDIARTAGISRSTLYLHYPTKAELLEEIAAYYGVRLAELVALLPGPSPSHIQITQWISKLAALMVQEKLPGELIWNLSLQNEAPATICSIGDRLIAALAQQIPTLACALEAASRRDHARAWADAAMRELGRACRSADSVRMAVAADIFKHFLNVIEERETNA